MCICFHSCIFTPAKSNMNAPGNKDPLFIISLIKAGQLQPQLQRWQCCLRQRTAAAAQHQHSVSVSGGSGSVSVNGGCDSAVVAAATALALAAVAQRHWWWQQQHSCVSTAAQR